MSFDVVGVVAVVAVVDVEGVVVDDFTKKFAIGCDVSTLITITVQFSIKVTSKMEKPACR